MNKRYWLPSELGGVKMEFVKEAWEKRKEVADIPEPLTSKVLESKLGIDPFILELWVENRNSRIYEIKNGNGKCIIAKQSKSLSSDEVLNEFNSLKKLRRINSHNISIPDAINLIPEYKSYLMDKAQGNPISFLIGSSENINELLTACRMAGKTIAKIHSEFNSNIDYNNGVDKVYKDICKMPSSISKSEKIILDRVTKKLENEKLPIGEVYKDYDPINIYYSKGTISLIDPPENFIRSFLFWDLATFSVGLRKALLKKSLFSIKNRNSKLELCIESFLQAYVQNCNYEIANMKNFYIVITLLEIQRIGELMVFQEKHRFSNKSFFSKSRMYNNVAIRILKNEKKKIICKLKNLKLD